MNYDFSDYMMGFFLICVALFVLVGAWALIKEVNMDTSISNKNNAHNVSVFRMENQT
jgi:hypothetical protein